MIIKVGVERDGFLWKHRQEKKRKRRQEIKEKPRQEKKGGKPARKKEKKADKKERGKKPARKKGKKPARKKGKKAGKKKRGESQQEKNVCYRNNKYSIFTKTWACGHAVLKLSPGNARSHHPAHRSRGEPRGKFDVRFHCSVMEYLLSRF